MEEILNYVHSTIAIDEKPPSTRPPTTKPPTIRPPTLCELSNYLTYIQSAFISISTGQGSYREIILHSTRIMYYVISDTGGGGRSKGRIYSRDLCCGSLHTIS